MILEKEAGAPLTDDDRFHDLIDGRRLVKVLCVRHLAIANRLFLLLGLLNQSAKSGRFFFGLNYDLGLENGTVRMPEVSFVSHERFPAGKRLSSQDPSRMTPDLVAEIMPSSSPEDYLGRKIADYRWAGVKIIWMIFPDTERIIVCHGRSNIEVLDKDGFLEGVSVLPEFRLPLNDLFNEEF